MLIFLSKEYIIILSEKGDTKMLIDFSFKNFMSFGDECCFDMLANSDKQHRESLIDGKYSRVRLIYGANASGKTSFIRAVAFVRWFILNSNQLLENMPIPCRAFSSSAAMPKYPVGICAYVCNAGKEVPLCVFLHAGEGNLRKT